MCHMAGKEVVPSVYKFIGKPEGNWPPGTRAAAWGDK
jgi:hypothetical protein